MSERRLSLPTIGDYTEFDIVTETIHKQYQQTPKMQNEIVIGIIGTSSFYTQADTKQLMDSVIELWSGSHTLIKIIFQQGGTLSMYIDLWAEGKKIEAIPLEADWNTSGSRACFDVIKRIERDATHFIIVRSPRSRSDKSLQKAEFLSKKREVIILQGYDAEAEKPNTLMLDLLLPPVKPIKKEKDLVPAQNNLLSYFQKKT
jgi:hypothetical protein